MFTVASGMNRKSETVISKANPTRIYEFKNLDDLLDFMRFLPDASRRIFTQEGKYRLELSTETAAELQRMLNEYAKFIGKSSLAVAHTHEHWSEL